MTRPKIIESVLKSIEDQLRLYANKPQYSSYFTPEELIKLGDIADQIAQIRFPITISIKE